MRKILIALTAFASLAISSASAQSTPVQGALVTNPWQRVLSLRPGTRIYVKVRTGQKLTSTTCSFKSADADSLTCARKQDVSFARADIASVQQAHRGRSALIGAGAGFGIGFLSGFAAATSGSNDSFFGKNAFRGAIATIFGAIGTLIGTPIGYFSDWSRSVIYTAP